MTAAPPPAERDRRWRWYRCPNCQNAEPGAGRVTGERLRVERVTYRPPVLHSRLGRRDAITVETRRLTCPCGHVWEATREV
jgi:hypothetical protein